MTADPSTALQRARTDLVAALSEIEDKLNLPKRARRSAARMRDENPFAFSGLVLVAIAGVAGLVWGAVRLIRK
jgi:hypothetical protein